jgi:hypothetical protein
MKQIPAWQAKDGKKFFTEAECVKHEASKLFAAWYYLGHQIDEGDSAEVYRWLTGNAEAIRGFLPPVEAKPELDIEVLMKWELHNLPVRAVAIDAVEQWLAGELK